MLKKHKTKIKVLVFFLVMFYIIHKIYEIPENLAKIAKCTPATHNAFGIAAGKKFQIKAEAIVAFNFKRDDYTSHSNYYNIYPIYFKEGDGPIPFDFVSLDNNLVFKVIRCDKNILNGIAVLIAEGNDSKKYAISSFAFRSWKNTKLITEF